MKIRKFRVITKKRRRSIFATLRRTNAWRVIRFSLKED